MKARPPVVGLQGLKQFVPATMAEAVMSIHQQSGSCDEWRDVHPSAWFGRGLRNVDLEFGTSGSVVLGKVLYPVGFREVFGQPSRPEVIHQRPILGDVLVSL
jgi:hypothetical protein